MEGGDARIVPAGAGRMAIVAAEFPPGAKPVLVLTSRVATRNYAVNLSVPGHAPSADAAELEYYKRPTRLLPAGGIVQATATEIIAGAKNGSP